MLYYVIVFMLMLALPALPALPALSIAIEASASGAAALFVLLGKWFVFWAVGMRLLLAGMRQIAQPAYTARVILGLKSDEVLLVVRELGFANVTFGLLGVTSLMIPEWRLATALAGGTFYGLAGVNHLLQPHRNRPENVAMVSDLLAAAVLLGLCIYALAA